MGIWFLIGGMLITGIWMLRQEFREDAERDTIRARLREIAEAEG